jgi:hypothetical protein
MYKLRQAIQHISDFSPRLFALRHVRRALPLRAKPEKALLLTTNDEKPKCRNAAEDAQNTLGEVLRIFVNSHEISLFQAMSFQFLVACPVARKLSVK